MKKMKQYLILSLLFLIIDFGRIKGNSEDLDLWNEDADSDESVNYEYSDHTDHSSPFTSSINGTIMDYLYALAVLDKDVVLTGSDSASLETDTTTNTPHHDTTITSFDSGEKRSIGHINLTPSQMSILQRLHDSSAFRNVGNDDLGFPKQTNSKLISHPIVRHGPIPSVISKGTSRLGQPITRYGPISRAVSKDTDVTAEHKWKNKHANSQRIGQLMRLFQKFRKAGK